MFSFFTRLGGLLLFLAVLCPQGHAQTLVPGDVVVVGYNFKDPDEFSLLPLVGLLPGTQLFITDCGWNESTRSFRPGEGLITYTVPSPGIEAGRQIHYPEDEGFVTQGIGGFFGLSMAGDQLLVFQGSWTDPRFVFALSDRDGSWLPSGEMPGNQDSHLPRGLIPGQSALALDAYVQARFECLFPFSNRQEFLQRLCDPLQWFRSPDRVVLPILGCGFDVLSVSLPWTAQWHGAEEWLLCKPDTELPVYWEYWNVERFETLDCRLSGDFCYTCHFPATENGGWSVRPCVQGRCEKALWIADRKVNPEPYLVPAEGCGTYLVLPGREQVRSCSLYDLQGREVWTCGPPESRTVYLPGLGPGFYILEIRGAGGVFRKTVAR